MGIPKNHTAVYSIQHIPGSPDHALMLEGFLHNDHPTFEAADPPVQYAGVDGFVTDPLKAVTIRKWMAQGAVLDVQHGVDNLLEAVRKLNAEDKALAGDLLRVLVGLPRHLLSDIQAYELDLWTAKIFAQCASEPPQYDTDGLMAAQAYDPAVAVLTVDAIRQTMTAQGYPAPLPMVEWHLETLAADTSEWQPVASEPACVGTTANWPLPQPGWYRAVATLKPYGQPPVVLGISQPVHIDAA